ncbi:MAG: response regulator [Deltaproteobacteria bacterium]|nr:response regulator [Deltaproteobacteria bacterium]
MSEPQPLILVVDDELPIRRFLRATLQDDYRTVEAGTGAEALSLARQYNPDAVLLDLGLPDLDGLEVVSKLRTWTAAPIVVVSARGREADKIAALDGGADDYLTKPFGAGELLARLRVALRHAARLPDAQEVFEFGDIRIDLLFRNVTRAGEPVHLTPHEYKLLVTLVQHAGKVVTHNLLLKQVWGPGASGQTHYLRVYMAQLRAKLEVDSARPRFLITEPGVGYRLRT